MKSIGPMLAIALGCMLLTACQGSSNGTTTTPNTYAQNCVMGSYGSYVNPQTGGPCTSGAYGSGAYGSCIMTAQGYYINQSTGQPCSQTGAVGGAYGSSYGYGGAQQQNPCAYATQMYGVQYTPTYVNGQLMCMNPYGS